MAAFKLRRFFESFELPRRPEGGLSIPLSKDWAWALSFPAFPDLNFESLAVLVMRRAALGRSVAESGTITEGKHKQLQRVNTNNYRG